MRLETGTTLTLSFASPAESRPQASINPHNTTNRRPGLMASYWIFFTAAMAVASVPATSPMLVGTTRVVEVLAMFPNWAMYC